MNSIDEIIEAISYSREEDIEWYEVFDSLREAKTTLQAAKRQTPDEEQMACLLEEAGEEDIDYDVAITESYRNTLFKLSQELKRANE